MMAGMGNFQRLHEQDRQRRIQESTATHRLHQQALDTAIGEQQATETMYTELLRTLAQVERRNAELEAQVLTKDLEITALKALQTDANIQLAARDQTIRALENDKLRLSNRVSEVLEIYTTSERNHAAEITRLNDLNILRQDRIFHLETRVEDANKRFASIGEHRRFHSRSMVTHLSCQQTPQPALCNFFFIPGYVLLFNLLIRAETDLTR